MALILIVDDSPTEVHVMKKALEGGGYRTAVAGDGQEGVRLAREMGLVKLGTVAIDGTKVKANASRHKAMSYEDRKSVV